MKQSKKVCTWREINNPYAADSDNDGLLDGEEIIKDKVYHFPASQFDPLNPFSNSVIHIVFSKKSDPLNRDSDDDGLLDGRPEYYNEFSIAPKDPLIR